MLPSNRASFSFRMAISTRCRWSAELVSSTSRLSPAFSFSRKAALRAIWFSLSLRASRDLGGRTVTPDPRPRRSPSGGHRVLGPALPVLVVLLLGGDELLGPLLDNGLRPQLLHVEGALARVEVRACDDFKVRPPLNRRCGSPGTVARARSSGSNSISISLFLLRSSFSRSSLARFDSW